MDTPSTAAPARRAGKYLTFLLDSEEYGLEILKVQEIIGMMEITPVPLAPSHLRGVINLRGTIIPVHDLRLRFGFTTTPPEQGGCIIVVEAAGGETGIVVDSVCEVLAIREEQIEDPPTFGSETEAGLLLGIGQVEGRVVLLLEIERTLAEPGGPRAECPAGALPAAESRT